VVDQSTLGQYTYVLPYERLIECGETQGRICGLGPLVKHLSRPPSFISEPAN